MPQRLDPRFDVLSAAQQQIWNALVAAPRLGFVLHGETAIALHLGHLYRTRFFGHKFDLSGLLDAGLLPDCTGLARTA